MNKFLIIIPAYNVEKWIAHSLWTIKMQSYEHWNCVIINDASTDATEDIVSEFPLLDDRFTVVSRGRNIGSPLANIVHGFNVMNPDDETIILNVDGDDWLSSVFVLDYLNQVYNSTDCWLTYGTYQSYPNMDIGDKHIIDIPNEVHQTNNYRVFPFVTSHLRTYKAFLQKNIEDIDLKDPETSDYWRLSGDVALMLPMLEMSGPEKIQRIPAITYVYNGGNEISEKYTDLEETKRIEESIRTFQKKYERFKLPLPITCKLMGGLGNMMFQIATTCALAWDHGNKAVFNFNAGQFPHKSPVDYQDSILCRVNNVQNIQVNTHYDESDFEYRALKHEPGLSLAGYFQSEKHFLRHRDKVLELFAPPEAISSQIEASWGHIFKDNQTISLHIRRGDYLSPQFNQHFHSLSLNYYKKALKYIGNGKKYKVFVFSDDIKWCRDKFSDDEFMQFIFVEESDVIELYLMSMCDHNIIANSSFSWWGAWLNQNKDKIVVCPEQWFGPASSHRNVKDLRPDSWIKMKDE